MDYFIAAIVFGLLAVYTTDVDARTTMIVVGAVGVAEIALE